MSKQTYPYYIPVKIYSGQLLKVYKDKKYKTYIEAYNSLLSWSKSYPKSFNEKQYGIIEYIDQYDCSIVTIFTKGKETKLINAITFDDLGIDC